MRVLDNAMLYFDKDQQEYKDAAFLKVIYMNDDDLLELNKCRNCWRKIL
jgi:hypothetical protein